MVGQLYKTTPKILGCTFGKGKCYYMRVKWKSLSCVWLFETPWTIHSMKFSRPEYWEWVAFPFSRGSSQARDQTQVSPLQADSLLAEPQRKPKNTGVGSLPLLQGIFPTQESNCGLLHCRQFLYQLSYEGSPLYLNKIVI